MANSDDIHFGDIDFGGLCLNGHDVPKGARYCPACGSPATPPTGAADPAPPAPVWAPPGPRWGGPGYGPPPGYPVAGAYGWPRPGYPTAGTNGLAVASLVLAIAGFLGLFVVGSVAAVICGHIAINQTARRPQRGRGLAVAGLVLGYLGLVFAVFIAALVAVPI